MIIAILRVLAAAFFVAAGINHFANPGFYAEMTPPWLPWPALLLKVAGACEILGGIGLLVPRLRRLAGWGLIALLVAVFPANVHAALHGMDGVPAWVLWARLPLQALFIAWVWAVSRPAAASGTTAGPG